MNRVAVGIDLGTVNTCVAHFRDNEIKIIRGTDGRITPSCVYYDPNSANVYLGKSAENKNHKNVIYDAKRFIGRRFQDPWVQGIYRKYAFDITDGLDNNIYFQVPHNKEVVQKKPEDISTEILKFLKEHICDQLETDTVEAVVTVPAHFSNNQREKTKQAAEEAGIKVLKLMNEPTAAALCYYHGGHRKNIRAMVFDLGGGTFDISIIDIKDEIITVKAVDGDTFLGGRNFDENITNYFKEKFVEEGKVLTNLHEARLKFASRKLKEALSFYTEAEETLAVFFEDDETFQLTKEEFDQINLDDFDRCLTIVKRCLEENNMQIEEIDEVILVGGSSRIPKIQEMLGEMFTRERLVLDLDPDEVVACGAAIQAALFLNEKEDDEIMSANLLNNLKIIDVNPLSLGVDQVFDEMDILIKKNTPLPTTASKVYRTSGNNQTHCLIGIFEGERKCSKYNHPLGELFISDMPAQSAGSVSVTVTFSINEDGILEVEATCHGQKEQLTLTLNQFELPKNYITRKLEDAKNNEAYDEEFMKFVAVKTRMDLICNRSNQVNVDRIVNLLHTTSLEDKDKITEVIDGVLGENENQIVVLLKKLWDDFINN